MQDCVIPSGARDLLVAFPTSVVSRKVTASTVLQRACGIQVPHCRRPACSEVATGLQACPLRAQPARACAPLPPSLRATARQDCLSCLRSSRPLRTALPALGTASKNAPFLTAVGGGCALHAAVLFVRAWLQPCCKMLVESKYLTAVGPCLSRAEVEGRSLRWSNSWSPKYHNRLLHQKGTSRLFLVFPQLFGKGGSWAAIPKPHETGSLQQQRLTIH